MKKGKAEHTFRDLVVGTTAIRGEQMKDVASRLGASHSTLSNILAQRFAGEEKEAALGQMTKETLQELFKAILGNLYESHKAEINQYVDAALEQHRTETETETEAV